MNGNALNAEKKNLQELINSLGDNEIYALQKFAEFLKRNKKDDKDKLMEILLKAPYEEKELSEKTKKDLKKSEEDIKKGRVRPLSEVMKDFGL